MPGQQMYPRQAEAPGMFQPQQAEAPFVPAQQPQPVPFGSASDLQVLHNFQMQGQAPVTMPAGPVSTGSPRMTYLQAPPDGGRVRQLPEFTKAGATYGATPPASQLVLQRGAGQAYVSFPAVATSPLASRSQRMFAGFVGEFLGTFVIVFTVGLVTLTGDKKWAPSAISSVVLALTFAFFPISGAMFNPMIAVALGLARKLSWAHVLVNFVIQCLAGILAGFAVKGLLNSTPELAAMKPHTVASVGFTETTYGTLLVFVFLNCAASLRTNPAQDGNQFFGMAIAGALLAGGHVISDIGTISLNPAVTLGLGIFNEQGKDEPLWMVHYLLAESCAAALGVVLFVLCRIEEFFPELLTGRNQTTIRLATRLLAEFLGTYTVTLTACCLASAQQGATAWAVGAAVMAVTYSLADVSGGHFNPVITWAVVFSFRRKLRVLDGLLYILTQLAAGCVAGLAYAQLHKESKTPKDIFELEPRGDYTWSTALALEFVFAAVVVFVFLGTVTTPAPARQSRASATYGLAVGFAYTAAIAAIGGASGGMINPATALATAVSSSGKASAFLASSGKASAFLAYSGCHVGGAIVANLAFVLTYPDEYPVFKGM